MGVGGVKQAMKVISFLGIGNYSPTCYILDEQKYETRFFPAAVAKFVRPEKMLVCETPTVQNHLNSKQLTEEIDSLGVEIQIVTIPEGHSESDLWEIFDVLTSAVAENETVIFDVTHSFRSLPILAFLAIAYLKAAKNVKVERILYGAWEAKDTENHSPVFDLTPFIVLLDWLAAANRFVVAGDGHDLAQLVRSGMPAGRLMKTDMEARALGKGLDLAADAIDSISLAMRLNRPLEVMASSVQFGETLEQSMPGIRAKARPFALVAGKLMEEYGHFALENPISPAQMVENLWLQLDLVEWYIRRRHIVQAATLAREWIVSLLAYLFEAPVFEYETGRRGIETALNNCVEKKKPKPSIRESSPYDDALQALPSVDKFTKLWSKLAKLRNDLAHVGMRVSPDPANLLKQKVESIYPGLVELAGTNLPARATSRERLL
jgi:CRISPR-associated DxTHG motif protein